MRVAARLMLYPLLLTGLVAGCKSVPTAPDATLAMGKFAGDLQVLTPSTSVTVLPAVRITDQAFNTVAGVTVTFSVASGGGTVTGGTAITDANGVARVGGWTMGPTAGTNSLSAAAKDVTGSPAVFIANTSTPGGGKPGDDPFLKQP
ncbi:MAG: hypothetical protein ABJC19_04620 [Gemmatimonadota bacterium]